MASISLKILFLTPYPLGQAPSQRFRFEQYLELLSSQGWEYDFEPFLDEESWKILYTKGNIVAKSSGILKGFLKRKLLLLKIHKYEFVFIHREAAPIGPPIFEWIISKVFRKRIIYDFDDAIWLPNTSENNRLAAGLKWNKKVLSICRWSHKISCGNTFLKDFASKYNSSVVLNPTTIDTENLHNPELVATSFSRTSKKETDVPVIGWTGSHSTLSYLLPLIPILKRLEGSYNFKFVVIANQDPKYKLKSYVFKKWNKDSEIEDLAQFNIGVMPLEDDQWSQGKCGFKALQYMALKVPALISAVGVNKEIISNGVEGFHCTSENDWYNHLEELLKNPELRTEMGNRGREKVIKSYSVKANTQNFLNLFR